ncbi:MAG TPA: peptide ABC transporter substrate-binding protein [Gammaproteobacteria bacterium]|nr:peptide ABC transporter substrate-binding protein [Gammaproteobacteria bacterium]
MFSDLLRCKAAPSLGCGILALLLLLGGCDTAPPSHIRFGVQSLPQNFDPRYATDAASERVNHLLYRGLVRFDQGRRPIPDLAEWSRPQLNRYRFTLRDQPLFDDGSRLSMRDVAATYEAILDPQNHSPHRTTLSVIDEIRVVDDVTLEFVLKRPDPFFPSYLVTGAMPAGLLGSRHDFTQQPVGSGRFRLLERDASHVLLLRKSDRQKIELVLVKDPAIRVLKLLRGEIHLMQNDLSPSLVEYLSRQEHVRLMSSDGSNFTYLGFNLEDPLTADHRIREAIAHAIDRRAILHYVFHDRARLANALFPPEHQLAERSLQAIRHDQQRARDLLSQAGYDAQHPLTLTYKTSSDPFRLRLATIIQYQLAEVGVEVLIKSYDWGTFFGDIKSGNFQLYSLTWVGIKTPDTFRYIFHSDSVPPAGANRGRYRSQEADSLIESAEAQQQIEQQIPLYRQLQLKLLSDLPYVPLWYEDQLVVYRHQQVAGYRVTADGSYDALEQIQWIDPHTHTDGKSSSASAGRN